MAALASPEQVACTGVDTPYEEVGENGNRQGVRMHKSRPDLTYKKPCFRTGDRVRLSELGEIRNPRKVTKAGRILSVAGHKSGSASVLIIFDGLKEPTRLHWTYIERIDHSGKDHD